MRIIRSIVFILEKKVIPCSLPQQTLQSAGAQRMTNMGAQ